MKNYINRLQNNDASLIELILWNKNISENEIITISDALKFNTTLQILNIGENNLDKRKHKNACKICQHEIC